jgi:hypothetical protein
MGQKAQPRTFDRVFEFANDRDLDERIAEFRQAHEREQHERIAMHARRSLGAHKVRITFRVVESPGGRRPKG